MPVRGGKHWWWDESVRIHTSHSQKQEKIPFSNFLVKKKTVHALPTTTMMPPTTTVLSSSFVAFVRDKFIAFSTTHLLWLARRPASFHLSIKHLPFIRLFFWIQQKRLMDEVFLVCFYISFFRFALQKHKPRTKGAQAQYFRFRQTKMQVPKWISSSSFFAFLLDQRLRLTVKGAN